VEVSVKLTYTVIVVGSKQISGIKNVLSNNSEIIFGHLKKNPFLRMIYDIIQKHQYIVLFFGVFLIYNLNFRNINSIDTIPASLLPFALLNSHTFQLDTFVPFILGENSGAFPLIGHHFYSIYPVVTPVLITPLYVIPYLVLNFLHIPFTMSNSTFFLTVFAMEKISASCISSLAIVFFFAGLKEIVDKKIALLTTLIFAFGTNMWSVCSQALWQHGMVALLFSIMFFLIVTNEKNEQLRNYLLLGVCSGLLVFNRPSDLFMVLPIIAYVFYKNIKSFIVYCLAALAISLPVLFYNLSVFHNIFGGYSSMAAGSGFGPEIITPSIGTEIFIQSIGLLFSPHLGLFIFTPIALLAVLGFFTISSKPNKSLRIFLYSFVAVFILETFIFALWFWNLHLESGTAPGIMFGPRYFSGFLPAICILIGIYLDSLWNPEKSKIDGKSIKNILIVSVISLFVIWSVFVQIVGAFYYPNGNWEEFPKFTVDQVGNVTDTPILKTFNEGPIIVNPVNILMNLEQRNDIIDPTTDFAIRMGTNLDKGWGSLEYNASQPVRAMGNYSSISVQYMRYSITENNCSLSLVAAGGNEPRTMMIYVNHKFVNNFSITSDYREIKTPVMLKSSLRLGNNLVEFRVPDNCMDPSSGTPSEKSLSNACIKIQALKFSCLHT